MKKFATVLALLTLALSGVSTAQCPSQPNGFHHGRSVNISNPTSPALRPVYQGYGQAPVRHVNVPVPNFARCNTPGFPGAPAFPGAPGTGFYSSNYYYGPGGFGWGFGGGFGVGAGPAVAPAPSPQRAARRVSRPAPADTRPARDYQLRKALNDFARDNSLGGQLYVVDGDHKWMLRYDGQPRYSENQITIPCIGRDTSQDGFDQRLTLVLEVYEGEAPEATVKTSL